MRCREVPRGAARCGGSDGSRVLTSISHFKFSILERGAADTRLYEVCSYLLLKCAALQENGVVCSSLHHPVAAPPPPPPPFTPYINSRACRPMGLFDVAQMGGAPLLVGSSSTPPPPPHTPPRRHHEIVSQAGVGDGRDAGQGKHGRGSRRGTAGTGWLWGAGGCNGAVPQPTLPS